VVCGQIGFALHPVDEELVDLGLRGRGKLDVGRKTGSSDPDNTCGLDPFFQFVDRQTSPILKGVGFGRSLAVGLDRYGSGGDGKGMGGSPDPLHRAGDTGVNRGSKASGHFSDCVPFGDLGFFVHHGLAGSSEVLQEKNVHLFGKGKGFNGKMLGKPLGLRGVNPTFGKCEQRVLHEQILSFFSG
jgi:hypothetical protein